MCWKRYQDGYRVSMEGPEMDNVLFYSMNGSKRRPYSLSNSSNCITHYDIYEGSSRHRTSRGWSYAESKDHGLPRQLPQIIPRIIIL